MRLLFSSLSLIVMLNGCATIDSNGFVISPRTTTTVYSTSLSENFDPHDINTINASPVPTRQHIRDAEQQRYKDQLNGLPVDTSYHWDYQD